MISPEALLFALFGGILPALLWLVFWLREDRLHPEPRRFILYVFLGGMLAVPLVLPLEEFTGRYLAGTSLFIVWAFIEEGMKLGAAYAVVLRRREVDEPIDAVMYMVTAALGFAALENTLFLLDPFANGEIFVGIMTGNLRFLGATLLHVLSSSMIGLAMALSFYRNKRLRHRAVFAGLILAIFLHSLFNFLILNNASGKVLVVFAGVWVGVIVLLLLFEKIKQIQRPHFIYLRKK